ncbi:hypothetical protein N7486_009677 [Penicillium sp. IBT 16267x]|nr:hypothetical protein N7486_009677 [Penicillium sp. IBT 16267x]
MTQSRYHIDYTSQSTEPEQWEYAPTPGYFGSPYAARSISSPSPSSVLKTGIERTRGRSYQEDPPTCIHYRIEWRVTINNREVSQDTEEDLTLAPSSFWQLSLEKKLEKVIRRKTARHRQVTADDTVITVLTSDRTKRKLTKRFDDTDIIWTTIEKQLVMWSDVLFQGKELTLKISFNYVDDRHSSPTAGRKGEKRGKSSVTKRMLSERDAQLDAEEHASGEKPIWRSVYNLMRCDSSTCQHGPHCWVDPMGKKHYPIKSHHIKRLITHVEKGGVLEGHKDVPEAVRDELYREEEERLGKGKRKGGHSTVHGIDVSTSKAADDLTALSPLEIPGSTDRAAEEYTEWLVSTVDRDALKAAFRQTCQVMLENGLDLEQVIWNPATGQSVSTLEGHSQAVTSIAWSPDGSQLALTSHNKIVKIWDLATRQSVFTLKGHSDMVSSIAWSPGGSRLASASYDKTVRIWDPATGQSVSNLEGHSKLVSSISWSPDGSRFASASCDKTVRIWDPDTGQNVSILKGHSDPVSSITWSPDGSRLASASYDKTVRIWDLATGQSVSRLIITCPDFLQFDLVNCNFLQTSTGTFDIGFIHTVSPMPHGSISTPEQFGYGLSDDSSWITYNGVNLLWLPIEYRPIYPSQFAKSASNLAIGCSSGRVIILALIERIPVIGL